jgi:hypothetical protein
MLILLAALLLGGCGSGGFGYGVGYSSGYGPGYYDPYWGAWGPYPYSFYGPGYGPGWGPYYGGYYRSGPRFYGPRRFGTISPPGPRSFGGPTGAPIPRGFRKR